MPGGAALANPPGLPMLTVALLSIFKTALRTPRTQADILSSDFAMSFGVTSTLDFDMASPFTLRG